MRSDKKLIQVNLDKALVDQAIAVLSELGLTQTTAVTAFFEKVVAEGGMPFGRELSPAQRATQSFLRRRQVRPFTNLRMPRKFNSG